MTQQPPIAEWSACRRCASGAEEGQLCISSRLRKRFGMAVMRVDRVRDREGGCGPDGDWFTYRTEEPVQ